VKTRIFVEFLTERLHREWSRHRKGSAAALTASSIETD
jgi:hypothetical protein